MPPVPGSTPHAGAVHPRPPLSAVTPTTEAAGAPPDLRTVLTAALTPPGAEPDALTHIMVNHLVLGLTSEELYLRYFIDVDLGDFKEPMAQRLIDMAPEGWIALNRESMARYGHGISTVVLSDDLSADGRIVAALRLLPELARVHVTAPSSPDQAVMDFAGLRGDGSKPLKLYIDGEATHQIRVDVPSGTEVVAAPGLQLLVRFINRDRQVEGSRLIGLASPMSEAPPELFAQIEAYLTLKDLLVFSTVAKQTDEAGQPRNMAVANPTVKALLGSQQRLAALSWPLEDTDSNTEALIEQYTRTENLKREDQLLQEMATIMRQFRDEPLNPEVIGKLCWKLHHGFGQPASALPLLRWAVGQTTGVVQHAMECLLALYLLRAGQLPEGLALIQGLEERRPGLEAIDAHPEIHGVMIDILVRTNSEIVGAMLLVGDIPSALEHMDDLPEEDDLFYKAIMQRMRESAVVARPQGNAEGEQDDGDAPAEGELPASESTLRELARFNNGPMREAWFRAWAGQADEAFAIIKREEDRGRWDGKKMMKFANSLFAKNLQGDERMLSRLKYYNIDPGHLTAIAPKVELPPPGLRA